MDAGEKVLTKTRLHMKSANIKAGRPVNKRLWCPGKQSCVLERLVSVKVLIQTNVDINLEGRNQQRKMAAVVCADVSPCTCSGSEVNSMNAAEFRLSAGSNYPGGVGVGDGGDLTSLLGADVKTRWSRTQ